MVTNNTQSADERADEVIAQADEVRPSVEFALKFPMLAERASTLFFADLMAGGTLNVNGNQMSRAMWNLIVTKRDLSLWCGSSKMKPNRHWKVTTVKEYFGLKGSGQKLLAQFLALYDEVERAHS